MNVATSQNLQTQAIISQQVVAKQYMHSASLKQQAKAGEEAKASAQGDRVELFASPQYTANLLFEKIAARVAEQFGTEAAQQIQFDPNLDTSPQATAERIFSFAAGFYQKFHGQHAGEDEKEILNRFMTTIRRAIDQGFKEAKGVLTGLSGFTPEIESMIDETYQRLQDMLKGYEEQQLNNLNEQSEESLTDNLLFPPPQITPSQGEVSIEAQGEPLQSATVGLNTTA